MYEGTSDQGRSFHPTCAPAEVRDRSRGFGGTRAAIQSLTMKKTVTTKSTKISASNKTNTRAVKVLTLEDLTHVVGGTCTFGNKSGCGD